VLAKASRIALQVAGLFAAAVDAEARFPHEAMAALREDRLLAASIPTEYGGLGCSVSDVAAICTTLGQSCGSTAIIFAMHQIQVACLARHGGDSPFFQDYLREAAARQWLIASGTSEVGVGGHIGASIAAFDSDSLGFRLKKKCSAVSYGDQADAILITARRSSDAAPGDQGLALIRKQDYQLDKTGGWDTLGMRGTCSPPYTVTAEASAEQMMPEPFRHIATQTMVPYSHILWSSAWLGIASGAVAIARTRMREMARKKPDGVCFGSGHLVDAVSRLQMMKAYVRDAASEYQRICAEPRAATQLSAMSYALKINNLKVASSRAASQICLDCLGACGLLGYANNSEFSVGRHLRDALGAPLMIANDRINAINAGLVLVSSNEDT
jgi:acyl-CoA dehydrogenase